MKRLFLALFALFSLSTTVNATASDIVDEQSPDSVYVVAYFCKNDTLEYIYTSEETRIKGSDTTTVTIEESKFRLVVLDSTATEYRIQFTELETKLPHIEDIDNDPKQVMLNSIKAIFNRNSANSHIVFTTNELGEIQHIVNWEEIRDNLLKTLETCWDDIYKAVPEASNYVDKNLFSELIKAKYSSEEQLIENLEGFPLLFSFHGSAFHTGSTTIENEGNDEEFPSTVQIAAYNFDPEEEERDDFDPDYEVAIITTSTTHGIEVKELVQAVMGFILNDNDNSQEVMKSLNATKDFDNATMNIYDGIEAYYWFNGWPSEIMHFNIVELNTPNKESQSRIRTKSLECVYRSCFNFMK